ncbi:MAG: TolC family protein, partial [Bacteroidales bacterium]
FLGFNERVSLQLVLPTNIPSLELEYSKTLEEAKNNNPEIMDMELQILEAERQVAEARSQKGLSADLFAQFGLSNVAQDIGEAYRNPSQQQRVEVGFQVPILDWGQGRGRLRMAQSSEEVVRTQVSQSLIEFDESIFLQVMQFNLQDDQVQIASKADTIADLRYEVTKQRFLIGKIDVLDLKDALEEKDLARRGFVEALRNYWDYYYNLRGLTLFDWERNTKLEEDLDQLLIQ